MGTDSHVNNKCFCINHLPRIFSFFYTDEPQGQDQGTEGSSAIEDDEGITKYFTLFRKHCKYVQCTEPIMHHLQVSKISVKINRHSGEIGGNGTRMLNKTQYYEVSTLSTSHII